MARQYLLGSTAGINYVIDAEDRDFMLLGAYVTDAFYPNVSTTVAGAAMSASVGTVSITITTPNVSVDASGVAATGSLGSVTVATVASVSFTATGVAASALAGAASVTSSGTATERQYAVGSSRGVSFIDVDDTDRDAAYRGAYVAIGKAGAAGGDVTVNLTGVAANAAVGTPVSHVAVNWFDVPPGSYRVYSSTGPLETVDLATGPVFAAPAPSGYSDWYSSIDVSPTPTGQSGHISLGSVTVHTGLSVSVNVTGFELAASLGAATVSIGINLGLVGVWTGSAFVQKPAKVWDGATWTPKPVKVWNGSLWV